MRLRSKILRLARVVADKAERDPEFAQQIAEALGVTESHSRARQTSAREPKPRPKNRRPPAKLDPVSVAQQGEDALRAQLSKLTLDELRDVVADHGMDPGKLVLKWKDPARVTDRIVEISLSRAQKGDAFRSS